jgi:DNA-binding MarR family transcriptional regulator
VANPSAAARAKSRARGAPDRTFPAISAWDRPGFLLWHATLRWQRAVGAALRPFGLTHAQFVLLAGTLWLETRDHAGPSQRELANHAGTDAMMTSQVVRALERQGLLRRQPDDADARIKRLRTTAKGRKLALRCVEVVTQVDQNVFGTVVDQPRLIELLRNIAARDEHGQPVS